MLVNDKFFLNKVRYIRIGSSKDSMENNPKKEKELFKVLESGYPTIVNTESLYHDLTFEKLFMYYGSKGISIKKETFKKNLHLLTPDGKYNIMAQLLSDNSQLPLRLSIFEGETKGSNLYAIKEFGFDCLLYSLNFFPKTDELVEFFNKNLIVNSKKNL